MVGTALTFLAYNEEMTMKQLLAIEAHLRELTLPYKSEHASCITKHALILSEQCDEGISHASELEEEAKAQIFREINQEIKRFRQSMEAEATPTTLIKHIREIRRKAEQLNKNYNVSTCKLCGPIEQTLAQLNLSHQSLSDYEQETADKMLEHLATKYNVPKPDLILTDQCNDPRLGLCCGNDEKTIIMCKGSFSGHVLAHEFGHYLQYQHKQNIGNEEEAEKFAINETQNKENILYQDKGFRFREEKSMKPESLLTYWGPQHLAKGLERGFEEVDRITGRTALKPVERPSFYLNVVGTVAGALGALYLASPYDMVTAIWGGHHSTTLWDYAEEYIAPAVTYRATGAQAGAPQVRYSVRTQGVTSQVTSNGRYSL